MNNNPPNPTEELIGRLQRRLADARALDGPTELWADEIEELIALAMRAAEPPHTGLTDVERLLALLNEAESKLGEEQTINRCLSEQLDHANALLVSNRSGVERRLQAVRDVIEKGYPGQPAKYEKCPHGRFGYEDCMACYDEALLTALDTPTSIEGEL